MSASKRDALLALVGQRLAKCDGCTEAVEYNKVSDYDSIDGDAIAVVKFGASGIETSAVDPSKKYNAEFVIDEANDRAIVSYSDIAFLSGWGGCWIVNLDGSRKTVYTMMS